MIEFPCICGNHFSVPTEMAGESWQCPKCLRLVTAPTLDDLAAINPDGTYGLDILPPEDQRRTAQIAPPADSSIPARLEELEIQVDEAAPPAFAPRYDPETGELIRELEVTDVVISAEAMKPLPRQELSKSAGRGVAPPPPGAWRDVFGELLRGHNLFVILINYVSLLVMAVALAIANHGLVFVYFIPLVMGLMPASQFSLTVQETGPEDKDELPTPLRNFDFGDDIWLPIVQLGASIMLCFLPAMMCYSNYGDNPTGVGVTIALAVVGLYFFPAVFMTACMDGIVANFRPDRLWGVIAMCGWVYQLVATAWGVGWALILASMNGMYQSLMAGMAYPVGSYTRSAAWYVPGGLVSVIALLVGLYLAYYGCWMLGLLWRQHHAEFPWVAQLSDNLPVVGGSEDVPALSEVEGKRKT